MIGLSPLLSSSTLPSSSHWYTLLLYPPHPSTFFIPTLCIIRWFHSHVFLLFLALIFSLLWWTPLWYSSKSRVKHRHLSIDRLNEGFAVPVVTKSCSCGSFDWKFCKQVFIFLCLALIVIVCSNQCGFNAWNHNCNLEKYLSRMESPYWRSCSHYFFVIPCDWLALY